MAERRAPAGAVLYEVVCTECGSATPGITSPDGCVDLDEQLVCGHDPIRRDLVISARRLAIRVD